MEKLDLNLIHQKIDKMSLDTWKVYQNKAKESEQETKKADTDSISVNSDRDNRLNTKLNEVKNDINFNSTAASGLDKIGDYLDSLRKASAKLQGGNLTDTEKAGLQEGITKTIAEMNKLTAETKVKDTKLLEKFSAANLGLTNIDLSSKEGLAKIEQAASKVKTEEASYNTKLEKNSEALKSINDKKEMFAKADELVQSIKSQIASNPLSAILTQSNGLSGNSLYSVTNAL